MGGLILKTVAYRCLSTLLTVLAALIVTGSVTAATGIGAIDFAMKTLFYAAFEHIWTRGNR